MHQGSVRIVGEDGLALDDVRYFAVEVQPAWPVLVVSPPGVSPKYLAEALAPRELRETGQARFTVETSTNRGWRARSWPTIARSRCSTRSR